MLLVGPLLRYVDETSATVFVEVDRPATVSLLGRSSPTFTAWGRHYALIVITGLDPGSTVAYDVSVDGAVVWPPADAFGPCTLSLPSGANLTVAGGSCRVTAPAGAALRSHSEDLPDLETDALSVLAHRVRADPDTRPDLLILAGDQLYSDVLAPATLEYVASRRSIREAHGAEVRDFDEYAFAYRQAWATEPEIRWLLATVPTTMIFDDHDVHNGWNSSKAWVEEMHMQPWWTERMESALGSYWVYQHLGNLSPDALADDPVAVAALAGEDVTAQLQNLTHRADDAEHATAPRWSFHRHLGDVAIVVLDSRARRVLDEPRRSMLDEHEWEWLRERIQEPARHLLVVTSVPVALPEAIEAAEQWADQAGGGRWGRTVRRFALAFQERFGLEHWPAYGDSCDRLLALLTGRAGDAADIVLLSGEVHYGYVATLERSGVPIVQVVSSPLRNPSTKRLRAMHRASRLRVAAWTSRGLRRAFRLPARTHHWHDGGGPWFRNLVATFRYGTGPTEFVVERTLPPEREPGFEVVHRQVLE